MKQIDEAIQFVTADENRVVLTIGLIILSFILISATEFYFGNKD